MLSFDGNLVIASISLHVVFKNIKWILEYTINKKELKTKAAKLAANITFDSFCQPGDVQMKSYTFKTPLLQQPVTVSVCFLNDFKLPLEEIRPLLPSINCALVNSSLVMSMEQLTAAIMKVFVAGKGMKTRSQYTELLYSLSPSTNVTESLKTFGYSESNSCAIAVRFNCEDGEAFAKELEEELQCCALDFESKLFEQHANMDLVKRTYKLSASCPSKEICTIISSKGI